MLLVSGFIGVSLFAPIALGIDLYFEPAASEDGLLQSLSEEWLSIAPPVTISWFAINLPWVLGYKLEKNNPVEMREEPTESLISCQEAQAFMSLVPKEKHGKLLFLKSELHYLQVMTDVGSTLILYNLSDAIAQLPASSGLSVHRSYWVALDAVEKFVRKGRQGELKLVNGKVVPVSRSNLQKVDAAIKKLA